ncbi:MAG: cupin domain-containing protein [Spirochaetaceae bacterium]|nr:cupin domain-containing protein [Spirochaetaceae bacterium]
MNIPASDIIKALNMSPHPEGGYFRETYRSKGVIPANVLLNENFSGPRNYCTAIYYLLTNGDKSHLHRIKQDEIWHFYLGGSLRLCMISPDGEYKEVILGQNIMDSDCLQYVVPAGWWFGATPAKSVAWSLVCCTVAPGFDFADFEMADKKNLCEKFPHLDAFIREFAL